MKSFNLKMLAKKFDIGAKWFNGDSKKLLQRRHLTETLSATTSKNLSDHDKDHENSSNNLKPIEDMPSGRSKLSVLFKMLTNKRGAEGSLLKMYEEDIRNIGVVMTTDPGNKRAIFIADPSEVVKLHRNEPRCPIRPIGMGLSYFLKENSIVRSGMFFASGEIWYSDRKIISPFFLRPSNINRFIPRLREIAKEAIASIETLRLADEGEHQHEMENLNDFLTRWSFESVSSVLFGRRLGALGTSPSSNILDFLDAVHSFNISYFKSSICPPFIYKFYRPTAYKTLSESYIRGHKCIIELIKESLDLLPISKEGDTQEFIPYLLSNKESKDRIDISLLDLLGASLETTSIGLQWILYMLARHKRVQNKLREEIRATFQTHAEIDRKAIVEMPYLQAVIKETFRHYPLVLRNGRRIQSNMEIGGFSVKKGTLVNVLYWPMSKYEKFVCEPDAFIPERWLRDSQYPKVPPFLSLPFGHGKRMCVGKRLAMLEMSLLLSYLLHEYKLDYPSTEDVEPLAGTVVRPDRPIRIKFTKAKSM